MSEPDERISSFTNNDRHDLEHQANLYRKSSLHAIDRFSCKSGVELICLRDLFNQALINVDYGMETVPIIQKCTRI